MPSFDTIGSPSGADWRYRISIVQDNQRRPLIEEELVERDGEKLIERPDASDREDREARPSDPSTARRAAAAVPALRVPAAGVFG